MLFGKIFYMIHRTISVRFLRDTIRRKSLIFQGFRIINKNPEFLAPSHGCVIQNRTIMHYTLLVV